MLTRWIPRTERMPVEADGDTDRCVAWRDREGTVIFISVLTEPKARWVEWQPLAKDASPLIPTFGPHGRWPTEEDAGESGNVLWLHAGSGADGTWPWSDRDWDDVAHKNLHFLPLRNVRLPAEQQPQPAPQPDENGWFNWDEVKPTKDDANDAQNVQWLYDTSRSNVQNVLHWNWQFGKDAKNIRWQRCPNVGVAKSDVVPISVDELPCRVTTKDGSEWVAVMFTDGRFLLMKYRAQRTVPERITLTANGLHTSFNSPDPQLDFLKKGWSDA